MAVKNYDLLLIEDDLPLAELVSDYLSDFEFNVVCVNDGENALRQIQQNRFDIILCDIMLPDTDGFNLLPSFLSNPHVPVLFLTAMTDSSSQVKGLNAGACDYILKPVDPEVLLARVRANIRMVERRALASSLTLGNLSLDKTTSQAKYCGETLDLTAQEFEVIWYFAQRGDDVVDRDSLFTDLIGRSYDGKDRAADLRISRLRKKLLAAGFDELTIVSIRSKGYVFKYWAYLNNA
ncbi:response regulator transcription factor [Thalassotalea ponticola]|uniref:response regulator transcription factor n=1 Tax=Thalassotalea ponticola TaxID=1523392 RepID=UPI0025B3BAD3|nr:response regulator transcription factor [Thalassotalea ponticola]MDN3651841.1 response regulator transcription factor [Thalassotalea ponticola]